MSSSKRGAFIVIEGLDRSGKSTQVSLLRDRLQDAENAGPTKVVMLHFPIRTTAIGKMIDAYLHSESELDDHTIHLLFSANRWELASTITAHLAQGTTVLADRYAFSGIAFSARKGLPYEWCRAPDVGLPAPDLTLFLNISPEVAATRAGYGLERYEKEEVQKGVKQVFDKIGREMQEDGGSEGKWVEIDAGKTKEEVAEDLWKAVEPLVNGVQGSIGRLWENL
ncbi:thymidylate kinase-domain-containing protein [Suillus fuscotomentosus]|uniref:Thymidylate kinase n=1 Tax=Suillus fuscotomentosus TaxID=1912939 RepID=A0AAD4E3H2_9AGAM|nr:thymidylate kinase-domain-containing protein [Suillus fuscotomentosus]KAG1898652.1 thymidylate kinase-domain-containing protein [Suillus fuscotomentosus]